jgi:hypothetical protein
VSIYQREKFSGEATMPDVSKPNDGEVIPNRLPVPYVTQYTDQTPTLSPFLVPGIAAGAFLMVEWGTLRWIDHAPTLVWLANTAIGLCVLIVVALKDWLSFKGRRYLPISLSILLVAWVGIVGFGYYLDAQSVPANAAKVIKESSEDDRDTVVRHLVTALSERDIARRDLAAAKRDLEVARTQQPQTQLPQPSPPEDQTPVNWQPDFQLNWSGDQKIYWIRFIGVSTAVAHIKDAYVVSTLTGHKEQLDVANATNFNERWKIDRIEPIPTGANVLLVYEPKPSPSLSDFMNQWGAFEFHVVYDDKEYVKIYSQAYINSKMAREMPGVFGPHVTPRNDK